MFILCYSRVILGLVCKVLLIPIVIPIIAFSYPLEYNYKQSHVQHISNMLSQLTETKAVWQQITFQATIKFIMVLLNNVKK